MPSEATANAVIKTAIRTGKTTNIVATGAVRELTRANIDDWRGSVPVITETTAI
jgi:hypothetical protein